MVCVVCFVVFCCCWSLCVELCGLLVFVVIVVCWLLVVVVFRPLLIDVCSLFYYVVCNMLLTVIARCELLLSFVVCC